MSVDKIGVVRSTAIAVSNKAVTYLELGEFISEFREFEVFRGPGSPAPAVWICGRTNTGKLVWIMCSVYFISGNAAEHSFPIDHVLLDITSNERNGPKTELRCTFIDDKINIERR